MLSLLDTENPFRKWLASSPLGLGKDIEILPSLWPISSIGLPQFRLRYLPHGSFLAHNLKLKQKALQFSEDVFLDQADLDTAKSLISLASDGVTQMYVHPSGAECMLRLGKFPSRMEASDHWKTARPLFERSSPAKQVSCIDWMNELILGGA
jgi:hypothetical protein